jgi:branched-subunit amino acid transport protein AzlD
MQESSLVLLSVILVVSAVTVFTRAVPFLFFAGVHKPPEYIVYLGKILPPAVMAMLLVFSVRGADPLQYPYGVPEFLSLLIIVLLHVWKRNNLISILGGTAVYMFCVQYLFV